MFSKRSEWAVGALVCGLMIAVCSLVQADSHQQAEYWKTRTRAKLALRHVQPMVIVPIAIVPEKTPEAAPLPELDFTSEEIAAKIPEVKPVMEARPYVVCYTAKWCGPCQIVHKDVEDKRFPFDVQFIDIDQTEPVIVVDLLPTFHWNTPDGKSWRYPDAGADPKKVGYFGFKDLTARWEATRMRTREKQGRFRSRQFSTCRGGNCLC